MFPHDVSLSRSNVRWNLFIQLNWLYQHSSVISLQCIGWADPVQWCARITGESAGQLQLSCPGWAPLQYSASEVDQSTLDSRSVWCPVQQFTCLPQVSPWHPALSNKPRVVDVHRRGPEVLPQHPSHSWSRPIFPGSHGSRLPPQPLGWVISRWSIITSIRYFWTLR